MRLLGFERVELRPGGSRRVAVIADPRLVATYDTAAGRWRIAGGTHCAALGRATDRLEFGGAVGLSGRMFGQ